MIRKREVDRLFWLPLKARLGELRREARRGSKSEVEGLARPGIE